METEEESKQSSSSSEGTRRLVKRKAKNPDEQKQQQQQQKQIQPQQSKEQPEPPLDDLTLDLHDPQGISIDPGGFELVVVGSLLGLQHLQRETQRTRFIQQNGLGNLFVLTSGDAGVRRIQVPVTRNNAALSFSLQAMRLPSLSEFAANRERFAE